MEKNYQIKTLFNGVELALDDLEPLRLMKGLSQSMIRYQILNFSLCIPPSFNVLVNTDGYDFIGYHPVYRYDYHIAPIIVTVSHEDVSDLQLGSELNQFTFMEKILGSLQSPLNFIKLEEQSVDGYEAIKVEQCFTDLGKKQTTFLWMMDQTLVKVAISFNEALEYSDDFIRFIIQNFKVNGLKEYAEADAIIKDLEKLSRKKEEREHSSHLDYSKELNLAVSSSSQTDEGKIETSTFQTMWQDGNSPEVGKPEKTKRVTPSQVPVIHQTFSLDEWLQLVGQMASQVAKKGILDDQIEE